MASSENMHKMWSLAKDGLVILVIPALAWIIKLEVGNAERDLRIEQFQSELVRLEKRVEAAEGVEKEVQAISVKIATLEGKLDTANARLSDVKALLVPR